MRTRRRTYTAATPASLFPEALTAKPTVQSCTANPRRNGGSKKKTKFSRLWDLNIPAELLREILSRLGLKVNIQASTVCKTWCEAAVSVRKWQPRPWLFYPQRESEDGTYILFDPSRSQTYLRNFPELENPIFSYSRDGWLLVRTYKPSSLVFLLNPFTRDCIYLPMGSNYFSAFSAAPTSTSCLVISLLQLETELVIKTWCPGATVWTTHSFENELSVGNGIFTCVFSNGMFYFLSVKGCLGVFDPSRETWNILPVAPSPSFRHADFNRPVLMTEHEGDIFVIYTHRKNKTCVFKLNLKRKVWEEKRELDGLTVFANHSTSLTRAGPSTDERNIIYPSRDHEFLRHCIYYYSLGNEKNSLLPSDTSLLRCFAWVDPPQGMCSGKDIFLSLK